jgi:DNA-binding SARP family transcriptional activator
VLGPVRVLRGGEPVSVGSGTPLDLLAALLVNPNELVPSDALIETVWHERLPAHPRAALHNAIARLRRALGADLIETQPRGYRLRSDADHLDLLKFEQLTVAADRAASVAAAEAALAEALGLWRGGPLRNVESAVLLSTAVPRLTDRYLSTCERWAGLCLSTGRQDAVVSLLSAVVPEHPFREQLVAHFMLALYRAGRQADALAAYDSVRRQLSEEMGIEPGAALQDLYLRIVRADPSLLDVAAVPAGAVQVTVPAQQNGPLLAGLAPPPVPRQLPPDLPDFCGREDEIGELTGLGHEGGLPGVAVISGPGGVGKTALAVHVAHRLSAACGDGQLFVDLNGVSPVPVQPAEALASFLRALGVAGQAMPHELAERIALYRSLVADRRLLIVLDNAASESQVRPLLPATAGCAVIITSRARMTGLPGARQVNLAVLDEARALELLAAIIGQPRADAEAADARKLAGLCGGLPLALRIAGARLAAKTHWPVATLAGRLANTRRGLNELVHGDLDVRASFALSYRSLDEAAKAMLRRASLLTAPDFPAWAGAALLDIRPADAEDICERLVDAQLLDVDPRPTGSRYRMHDLVRAFAREQAVGDEAAEERKAALARAFGGLLWLAQRAHCRVYGADSTILHGTAPRWPVHAPDVLRSIEDDALRWLDAERYALAAAIRQSAELSLDELTWDLAWTSVTLYETRAYNDDWAAAQRHALAAVREAGSRRGIAAVLCIRASMLLTTGRFGESEETAAEALRIFTEVGDVHGCAIARYRLAVTHVRNGRAEAAIAVASQALGEARAAGDPVLEAVLLRELGSAHILRGEHELALNELTDSLRLGDQEGTPRGRAMSLHMLGELHLRHGDVGAAEDMFRRALAAAQTANDVVGLAHTTLGLGETLVVAGRGTEAEPRLRSALALARQAGQRIVEARVLLTLGGLYSARRPDLARSHVAESVTIFGELSLDQWRRRALDALRQLDQRAEETVGRSA